MQPPKKGRYFMINNTIKIQLPDGSTHQKPRGTTSLDIAGDISSGLARNVLAAKVNGSVMDAVVPLESDSELKLLTWDDPEGRDAFWHSSAHLMAEAIENLYPGVKFGIGPSIDQGFYYDIDPGDYEITQDALPAIEKKIKELAKEKQTFKRTAISKKEALDHYTAKGDEYKVELIQELEDGHISFYQTGEFVDLCRGPHIPHTGFIKAIKLLSIAGAFWRGDESRKQLTRIYGISFPKKKLLEEHLQMLEEARKRDHRKIGRELEIFAFSHKVGAGLPLWLPKGAELRERLENFLNKLQKEAGYQKVITPHIGNVNLYKTSGHYQKYGQDSFRPIETPHEGEAFMLKPMNCPHHCELYNTRSFSFRDLPVRYAEFGTVYRYEQSGELHGLTRVRGFTQDDAHIFCTPDQLKREFKGVIDIILKIFKALDLKDYEVQVSLRDPGDSEKYIGSRENWEKAERAILEIVEERDMKTRVEYGEAAFYGPKLDFMVKDALGREWQLGTVQVDYNLPIRFQLEYTGSDNQKHRPVMIHRAPFGSMERFVAVLLEHTAGKFPLWLTPEQVAILPISEKYHTYAENILSLLHNSHIRGQVDQRAEKIGRKIRDTELKKTPYMLIVGEKEEQNNQVSVRKQGEGDLGTMDPERFIQLIKTITKEELNV